MYAYNYQSAHRDERRLNARPRGVVDSRVKPSRAIRKKVVKKRNPFLNLLSRSIALSLIATIGYFVLPAVTDNIYHQPYIKRGIKTTLEHQNFLANSSAKFDSSVDIRDIITPPDSRVYNSYFMGEYLRTPVNTHNREISSLYMTNKMTGLEHKLRDLMKSYPKIEPGIFVWEYDSGNYLGINEEKSYPAASIIKIPVLVRLFKSIEANQLTIYDEMTLTDYYRASGSGDLQYKASGLKLTMDALANEMITVSDNTATNMIMAKIGSMEDINSGLRKWGIGTTRVNNWLPDLEGTNKTTALDMAKILYNLDNPGFLNVNSREYIIGYMSHVKNNRLIQAGIDPQALFIHKTGDIGKMLGDAGIVYAPNGKRYIVVMLANRPYNHPDGKTFIQKASKLVYDYIVEGKLD